MVEALSVLRHDAWVRAHVDLLGRVGVLVRGHVQTLVVAAAVAQHDLRRVLVGHHHGGARQTASVRQGVVWLKRLLHHAGVEGGSHLVGITTHKHDKASWTNRLHKSDLK